MEATNQNVNGDGNDIVLQERNADKNDDRELPAWMLRAASKKVDDGMAQANREEETNTIADRSPVRNSPGNLASADLAPSRQPREPCKYAERCYRRNPTHRAEYSHPGDDDYSQPDSSQDAGTGDTDSRPECQYGTACYRRNPKHRREFGHTRPPLSGDEPARPSAKRRRRAAEDEYESAGENEYDLSDPFIDDSENSEGEEDDDGGDEDEDYVPENNDIDPELLNEAQWRGAADDAPEVLELLKDARDYLRNKKMHK